jgi:hypothetical protein
MPTPTLRIDIAGTASSACEASMRFLFLRGEILFRSFRHVNCPPGVSVTVMQPGRPEGFAKIPRKPKWLVARRTNSVPSSSMSPTAGCRKARHRFLAPKAHDLPVALVRDAGRLADEVVARIRGLWERMKVATPRSSTLPSRHNGIVGTPTLACRSPVANGTVDLRRAGGAAYVDVAEDCRPNKFQAFDGSICRNDCETVGNGVGKLIRPQKPAVPRRVAMFRRNERAPTRNPWGSRARVVGRYVQGIWAS